MGRWDAYWKFLATVFVLGTFYLLFTLIQTFELQRQSNAALLKELQQLRGSRADAVPAELTAKSHIPDETADVANRKFFDPQAVEGGELVSLLTADAPGFNPLTVNEATSRMILSLCSAPLAERDWEHPERFEPMLAESWEISEDKKTYTVRLRKNCFWQSYTDPVSNKLIPAREITAEDFKFAVDAIKNPDVDCASMRVYYQDLEAVEVVGKYELIFRWKKVYYGSKEATLGLSPLPRHFYCPDGKFDGKAFNDDNLRNRMIVGCGPYRFVRWDKEQAIVLEKNPDYFGISYGIAPPIKKRIFKIVKLSNNQFQALLSGKAGMISLTPEQWVKRTAIPEFESGKLKRLRYSTRGYTYIGYNHRYHCFSDSKTRRALTMLIDREKILKNVFFNCGVTVKSPFAPGTVYTDADLKPYAYDPERAKALLREAGWRDADGDGILERDGKKFEFTMLQISGSSTQAKMLPMIKESFAAAGIDMKLQPVEWSVYIERLNSRNFEACNLGWTGTIDPDLYQIFHSSQMNGGDNFISYKNEMLDRRIEELRVEFDLKKRIEICREIEKILHADQPYSFMFCSDALVGISSEYRNVRLFSDGLQPLIFWRD